MKVPCFRTSPARAAAAAALATAALGAAVPSIVHAAPAAPGDRSLVAVLQNTSSVRLTLAEAETEVVEGEWTTEPPRVIKNGGSGRFGSMSDGDKTGTEATIVYRTKYGAVEVHWEQTWKKQNQLITCDAPAELRCDVSTTGTTEKRAAIALSNA
ncbi:hypothetical protein AB0G04_34400 [Actinoplanes sp. NPDC023801]|uniref:hypothetical protein n=1 Tax=Actinoplanes sp. NPDC023801 TaxID=3154595 RepID=UPI0033E47803